MVEAELEIVNRLGLHARAAAKLVHTANRFECDVRVARDGEKVDAKSILGILLLAAAQGSHVTVSCEGSDEDAALEAISKLIAERFGEEQ
jgi:phosphocarrier protein